MNPGNPNADAYMIVGNFTDNTESLKIDGAFHFRLTYDKRTVEWKQTSWLTETAITGFECISPADCRPANRGGNDGFEGLARSRDWTAVFDGNGHKGSWWNVVG